MKYFLELKNSSAMKIVITVLISIVNYVLNVLTKNYKAYHDEFTGK